MEYRKGADKMSKWEYHNKYIKENYKQMIIPMRKELFDKVNEFIQARGMSRREFMEYVMKELQNK